MMTILVLQEEHFHSCIVGIIVEEVILMLLI